MEENISKERGRKKPPRAANGRGTPPVMRLRAAALAVLAWAGATALLFGLEPALHVSLALGQRAPSTVVATVDFTCTDFAQTELVRRQAAESVLPVFTPNAARLAESERQLRRLFDRVQQRRALAAGADPADPTLGLGADLELVGLALPPEDVLRLIPGEDPEAVFDLLVSILQDVWQEGIVLPSEKANRFRGVAPAGRILIEGPDPEIARGAELAKVYTPREAVAVAVRRSMEHPVLAGLGRQGLDAFWSVWLVPNLVYEPVETGQRRAAAERSVVPASMTVRAGTTLVENGERATPLTLELLREHARKVSQRMSRYDRALGAAGSAALLAIGLLLAVSLAHVLQPDLFRRPARAGLFAALSLTALVVLRLLLHLSASNAWPPPALRDFLLPLAVAPLLAAVLAGPAFALVVGAWTSPAAAVLCGNSFDVLLMGLLVTAAAALAGREVRRRSRLFQAGLWIGLTKLVYVLGLALYQQHPLSLVALQALAALGSSIAASLIVLLLVPLFETLFGLTSDIRLLELSDPGHPLMRRLAVEAPGTYHHSLMVANLAQAAAEAIGANGLLVRVCACFHDVGKLVKPDYFTENAHWRTNPHDTLTPSMSTLVITAHVKEGIGLARAHKLPRPILEAIRQHHGTGLVSYFYHRACEQQREEAGSAPVRPADFRYGGPLPASREMAVLALADAVEAASRSLEKPTPTRVQHLIEEVIRRKMEDGQLADAALTFSELTRIRQSFVFSLTNMLHGRVAYPSYETGHREPTARAAGEPPPPGRAGAADHDERSAIERSDTMG